MSGQITECPSLAPENTQYPGRFGRHVDDVLQLDLGRDAKAVLDVAMALPQHLQVDRHHQRAALGCGGTLDHGTHEAAIPHDIELEPEPFLDCCGHVLD